MNESRKGTALDPGAATDSGNACSTTVCVACNISGANAIFIVFFHNNVCMETAN
jgi:hypothetical protein